MRVKGRDHPPVLRIAHLVVSARDQLLCRRPILPVIARSPVQLSPVRVSSEQKYEPRFAGPPWLGVGEFVFQHQIERGDIVWLTASVNEPRPNAASAADEYPDVAGGVELDRRIVVRVVDGLLVVHDDGAGEGAGGVVVVRNHGQELPVAFVRGAAVDEEGFIGFGRIDSQRMVFGRVRPEAAAVLIAVLQELPQCEPDAAVTVDGARSRRLLSGPAAQDEECEKERWGPKGVSHKSQKYTSLRWPTLTTVTVSTSSEMV